MGKQIATYNNKVKQLVPGYDLKSYSPGTITVTRDSVENEQYASWSQNEDEQGMYIKQYSIGDGKTEYSNNQLVAMVNLYYRYLSPINGENYEGGERPYQLGDDGCIEIDNLSKTIEKGASYEFTLTPKSGFSMVPAGHIEVKDGANWSSIDISWQNTEGAVNITIPSDKITGNLRFALNDCLYKLYIQKTVDGHDYGDPEEIGIQNCSDTVNVNSLKPAEDPTGTHFVNITKDGTVVSGNQQFCGDTTLNINYAINQYTIDTSGVNSDCVDIVLSPNVQTIEHGESLTITLTPKEGKRNIGAGSITMGNTAVRTWTSERSITETVSSVEGDIVVIASCGEEDTYTITVNWADGQTTLHTETYVVQNGTTITPEDYVSDWTLPEGYHIDSMSPAEGTSILVDSNKTITYDCRLYEYNINFVAGNGVTLNYLTPQYVIHGESLTINDVYEINQGYRSATETHTGNAEVSLDNGNVTVTNVKSDVTITISASQIPSYYVSFAFDDLNAGTLDPDRVQVLEDGCAEIEYTLNQGYTIDTIDTEGPGTETHTSNTIKVCNVTGDVTVTINTNYEPPIVTHTVTYTLTGNGVDLVRGGQIVPDQYATEIVEDGENSSIGFKLHENYDVVIANCADPQIEPIINYNNNTISVNNVTKDITISISAIKSPHTVTFEVYKDRTIDTSEGWSRQYTNGDTFNDVTFTYDDSLFEINNVTSQELAVNYNQGDPGEIVISTETPITEDATIEIYLDSVQQKTIKAIVASGMDAMGGVIFQAQFDDGTYDSDQTKFSVSYTDNNGNTSTSKDVVDVFDYSLDKGDLESEEEKEYVSGRKGIYQKSKLDLDYPSGSRSRTERVIATYQDYSETINITQRVEDYGYYTNGDNVFDASSSSNDLMSATWKSGVLVDYGDSSNMYGGSDLGSDLKGLDGYNKDITPYYMTGTYIGENPLEHLTTDEGGTITGTNKPSGISTYNTNTNAPYDEHFHITWNETDFNKVSLKGNIFTGDVLIGECSFCGGVQNGEDEGCGCDKSGISATYTLEAVSSGGTGISKSIDKYEYRASYVIPSHRYGKDSISYYHIDDNNDYKWNINNENNPFKDSNEDAIQFSYPLHIYSSYDYNSLTVEGLPDITRFGSGPTSYALSTIRWRLNNGSEITPVSYQPDAPEYNFYNDNEYLAYYDYNNRITLNNNEQGIEFDPYNNSVYEGEVGKVANNCIVGTEYGVSDIGRIVDTYFTLMSPETLIRPKTENGVTKFGVLSGIYNGTDYSQYEGRMYSVGVSDYISNSGLFGRTRYVSQHSWNVDENESREPTDDISIENYPYTIAGTNVNYEKYYDAENDDYKTLNERISSGVIPQHCWYNLIAQHENDTEVVSFTQYRNTQNQENWYLHNSSDTKYVDCSPSFEQASYERYSGSFINEGKTWEDIVREDVISITPDENHSNRYVITTSQGSYDNCYLSGNEYKGNYYRQKVFVGTYYTNATNVYLSYEGCSSDGTCKDCGIGSISWEVNGEYGEINTIDVGDGLSYTNSDNSDLQIDVYAYTNRIGYDPDRYTPGEEESNVFTSGGYLEIVGSWENNYSRKIVVGIEGSGTAEFNPGESGGKFTWAELNQYYYNTLEYNPETGQQEKVFENGDTRTTLYFRIEHTE